MYVCVVYIYVCVCVYIYICVCVIYILVCVCIYICVCVVYIYMCVFKALFSFLSKLNDNIQAVYFLFFCVCCSGANSHLLCVKPTKC